MSLKTMDGNNRKKIIKLLQIASLICFIIIMLSIQAPVLYSQDMITENSSETVDIEGSRGPINIIITSNNNNNNYEKSKNQDSKKQYPLTIVTGASGNHFCPLQGFIYNTNNILKGLNARIIIYDLGLTKIQQDEIKSLRDNGYIDELRVFNFSNYPSFWNISKSRGEYAWKPAIIKEVSNDYPGIITWFDSGTLPGRRYFDELNSLLDTFNGFLSPRSSGYMKDWTHPGVYEYYDDDPSKYNRVPNCNGASVAFDTRRAQHLIDKWFTCALDKDCIAPVGSSRDNHRQDQAILTYLAAREERYCNIKGKNIWIYPHQDKFCKKIINSFKKII